MRYLPLAGLFVSVALVGPVAAQGFDVKLIVDSASQGLSSIDPEVSINEHGALSFVGTGASGSGLFVWRSGTVTQVAPYSPGRQYFGSAINDEPLPMVASRDRTTGSPPTFRMRKWPADGSNLWQMVGFSPMHFDSCTGFVSINDHSLVSFTGLTNGSSTTELFAGITDPPTSLAAWGGNQTSPRPDLSETDEIVLLNPSGDIFIWPYPSGLVTFVAGAASGFTGIGRYVGISSDGIAVGFTGDRGNGPGIFVSIDTPIGRQIVAAAGDGAADGFTGFDGDKRVGVATSGALATGLTVTTCFVGTNNGALGVYAAEVSATYTNGQFQSGAFAARHAVLAGDSVGGKTVASVGLYHPLTRQGVIACWASFTDGSTGIVRAIGDRDGDGLLDTWETTGIDVDNDGTSDYDLAGLGADPDHKDLFVEIDAMVNHTPSAAALADVEAAFDVAPVTNPDGNNGVHLHALVDETTIPESPWPNTDANGWPTDFDTAKSSWFGTSTERTDPNHVKILDAKRQAFRYCIFARSFDVNGATGKAERPGNDFFVAHFSLPTGVEEQVAGTFMHELGHSLGLQHGGGDSIVYKPNYFSVMNYTWQWPLPTTAGVWQLGYSSVALPTLDEAFLSEPLGLGALPGMSTLIGPPPGSLVPASGAVDLDGDGLTDNQIVARDLTDIDANDPPSPGDILDGYDDWSNLIYDFKDSLDYADGLHATSAGLGEIDQAIAAALANLQPAPAVYCTPLVNSLGCTPQIGYTGTASLTDPDDFFITAVNVRNKKWGILVWGTSSGSQPFHGGTLCVAAPLLRVPVLSSGGSASGDDCTGSYSLLFSQAYMQAQNLIAGSNVFAQIWSRDSSAADPFGIGLTAGLVFVVLP